MLKIVGFLRGIMHAAGRKDLVRSMHQHRAECNGLGAW